MVNGSSEFRWPLKELKVTVPRAVSGTRTSMLPLKVSTSMELRLGSHDFSRMLTGPLNVLAEIEPDTSFRTRLDEKPCSLCGPSTPSTVTGELNTSTSSWVRRGTLMSRSVSTTLFAPLNSHHE